MQHCCMSCEEMKNEADWFHKRSLMTWLHLYRVQIQMDNNVLIILKGVNLTFCQVKEHFVPFFSPKHINNQQKAQSEMC